MERPMIQAATRKPFFPLHLHTNLKNISTIIQTEYRPFVMKAKQSLPISLLVPKLSFALYDKQETKSSICSYFSYCNSCIIQSNFLQHTVLKVHRFPENHDPSSKLEAHRPRLSLATGKSSAINYITGVFIFNAETRAGRSYLAHSYLCDNVSNVPLFKVHGITYGFCAVRRLCRNETKTAPS